MAPETLAQVLLPIRNIFNVKDFPDLLVGLDVSDDAAVYKINDQVAVIHTLDFFTPVVDNPYDFGAIAAANALSDIYAMGGTVVMALNICGFPADMPTEIISEILRGGAEKVAEAGGVVAGGHTVTDKEPKYGLSVMGIIHPDRIWTKAGAQPGDILILTKPLGVGIITTAAKGDCAASGHIDAAIVSMKKLNRAAATLLQQYTVHACTDITGFSLLGHCVEIAQKSKVQIRISLEALPFIEGAKKYAEEWLFPCGTNNNEKCYNHQVTFSSGIKKELQMLLYTPETSGGLIAALAPDSIDDVVKTFAKHKEPCWVVGQVGEGTGVVVNEFSNVFKV